MNVPDLEVSLGMTIYATRALGVGGRIRHFPEDFVVEEILADGSRATVKPVPVEVPKGWGRHLLCLLVKRNWDTLTAVERIAEELKVDRNHVRIAGIKDARALTAQHISVSMVTPEKVLNLKVRGLEVYPIRFEDETVSPGRLYGNHFHIAIRSIRYDPLVIEERINTVLKELKDLGGIPNYFGHQRFGTKRPITHLVGRQIVKGNLEEAALTFLSFPGPFEDSRAREARIYLGNTRDYRTAFKIFPEHLIYERIMLRHLLKHPRDYLGAFRRLPLKLRRLFVQAYQSYLYNMFLSERAKRGIPLNDVMIGDHALTLDDRGLPTRRVSKVSDSNLSHVRERIHKGEMVLGIPLIGLDVGVSGGIQGEIEREILSKEGVAPRDFDVECMPEVRARGEFRRALAPIINLEVSSISEDPVNPSRFKVELDFILLRGSYATVLLREIMKPQNVVEAGF
ncbi:MAG: pseudouridine synthase [Candidatus Bathyarchaeota archaeon B26-2]|nr:MAG: pseudouridine synthase [Candidatus Bathyarchaeota archaeon B26-2]